MARQRSMPVALTIAGSDSGGGAGIQADLKVFAGLGVHGASATTALTAQNPRGVYGIQACSPGMVRKQIEAVFAELPPAAVKTGMLLNAGIVRAVADCLKGWPERVLIVDPVMIASSGARLLHRSAIRVIEDELLPLATLVTPNIPEAELLLRTRLRSVEDSRKAARNLRARFGCAALVKGGHLRGLSEAADIFYDGRDELLLTAPFIRGVSTHGTGCVYSAAIAAYCARGEKLTAAVSKAKEFVTQAIARSIRVSGHSVLNCLQGDPT